MTSSPLSAPMTVPSELDASGGGSGRDLYRKVANDLDSLLDEAMGQFGGSSVVDSRSRASGSFLGGSVASSSVSRFDAESSLSAFEVADDHVTASRQDRYRSLVTFFRWSSLLCYVEPGFATAARQPQIDSWALSSAFAAWALQPRLRATRGNNSRPSSPVTQPGRDLEVRASAVFGAWAGEAKIRAQERISITSHAIGVWCAHTQRARHKRELGEAADAVARGRTLLAVRQVLILWQVAASQGARHSLGQSQFADRWAEKHRLCQAFLAWQGFSSGRQLEHGIESFLKENVSDIAYEAATGNSSDEDDHVAVMPAVVPGAEEIAAPNGNAALDDLGELLGEEDGLRKALAKAEQFCASRLAVRVTFFFTFWAAMRGTMTPRDRLPQQHSPPAAAVVNPEPEPERSAVTEVAQQTSEVVKPAARKPTWPWGQCYSQADTAPYA